ncbi:hypothetical protein VNI00_007224 [Paramarasmius palmivorus]|uniref:Carboxylic ester hydrolase n=1 Tax=Paramarasmius palmivorus TaxID=297713 RepID=A0AAW0D2G1_9AGAR
MFFPNLPNLNFPMLFPILGLPALLSTSFDFDAACTSIGSQVATIQNASLVLAQSVKAGTNLTLPIRDASCGANFQVVSADICRVGLNVTTSTSSGIYMESWLPRNWTGRFLSTGNGGLGGCGFGGVNYGDLAYTSALGFAASGANNGHDGNTGAPFEGKPEVVKDFAYRSIHTNVVTGKQITKMFYGMPHQKSYYFGCSTGGRQGLKSVQDFPEDFDGVLAGAPAANFNALTSWSGHFLGITGPPGSETFISSDLWVGLIRESVLKQCDGIDGVEDGIIEDPDVCEYDPSVLLCGEGQTTGCLTQAQVETVKGVYSPFVGSKGEVLFPRAQPGSESQGVINYAGVPFQYTSDWFRYVVYNASFDPTKITLADYEYAIALNPFDIATWKGDISAFRDRNGKLLSYHGQIDGIITPKNSEAYYDHVLHTMSLDPSSLDDFYRLFRISGMAHCSGGVGAWSIGGQGSGATTTNLDPGSNVLTALVKWVEEGVAPETVMGYKYVNDTRSLGVEFQ